jgi:hypothetical protein
MRAILVEVAGVLRVAGQILLLKILFVEVV